MPQTVIDCCNSALQRIGATTIISLTDNSPEAKACVVAYDSNRRDELRKHKWNFAITRVKLSPDSATPAFDYTYQFTLPSDCLRVLRPNTQNLDWVIEGRKILTNDSNTLNLRYIADIVDNTQFDATFYNVLAASLALDLVEKLTQSNVKKQILAKEYEEAIKDAKQTNALENGPIDPPDDYWWTVRL